MARTAEDILKRQPDNGQKKVKQNVCLKRKKKNLDVLRLTVRKHDKSAKAVKNEDCNRSNRSNGNDDVMHNRH